MRFFGIVIWCELAFGLKLPGMGLFKRHNSMPSVNDIMLANWKRSPFHKRGYSPLFNDPDMYASMFAKRGIKFKFQMIVKVTVGRIQNIFSWTRINTGQPRH